MAGRTRPFEGSDGSAVPGIEGVARSYGPHVRRREPQFGTARQVPGEVTNQQIIPEEIANRTIDSEGSD